MQSFANKSVKVTRTIESLTEIEAHTFLRVGEAFEEFAECCGQFCGNLIAQLVYANGDVEEFRPRLNATFEEESMRTGSKL